VGSRLRRVQLVFKCTGPPSAPLYSRLLSYRWDIVTQTDVLTSQILQLSRRMEVFFVQNYSHPVICMRDRACSLQNNFHRPPVAVVGSLNGPQRDKQLKICTKFKVHWLCQWIKHKTYGGEDVTSNYFIFNIIFCWVG